MLNIPYIRYIHFNHKTRFSLISQPTHEQHNTIKGKNITFFRITA